MSMAKILQTFFVILSIVCALHSFPQKPSEKSEINTISGKGNVKKQNTALRYKQFRKTRNVEGESIDISQIGTFPATIDDQLDDTKDLNGNIEQNKPLERSQISILPASINFEEESSQNKDSNDGEPDGEVTNANDSTENTAVI